MRKDISKGVPTPRSSSYLRGECVGLMIFVMLLFFVPAVYAEKTEKWQGIDESIIEKVAKEHGREATTPLINTGQGDLLLFAFLTAGAVGGFVAGYYWRILMVEKAPKSNKEKQ